MNKNPAARLAAKARQNFSALRDRFVGNPDFRQWAVRFPLTRPIARRRTGQLFDLCAGFVYSQILHACVQLDLFTTLAAGPRTAAEIGLPEAAAKRLLDAATALQLTEKRGADMYGLGPLGAAMVGNLAVQSMVAHHAMLYADLADPIALLNGQTRKTQLAHYWAYATASSDETGDETGPYSDLMAASQTLVAHEILGAYRIGRHLCLLDVGGGDGSFLRAAAARAPGLRLMLFDLPAVAARAEQLFAEAGLAPRARAIGGSFLQDALPLGADVISLVRVVHDHDDEPVRHLLRQAWLALPAGGTLLLAEPMAETPGAQRMGDAYFGFYLLAMGSGRPRSAATLTAMLHGAGFSQVRQARTNTPLLTGLLVATKA